MGDAGLYDESIRRVTGLRAIDNVDDVVPFGLSLSRERAEDVIVLRPLVVA